MSHEVESMMYVGRTPWHETNCVYVGDENILSDEAIVRSKLNWLANKHLMFALPFEGNPTDEQMDTLTLRDLLSVPDHRAVVRDSDKAVFGSVGAKLTIFQNFESFEFLDDLVEQGMMRYHTAGSLRGGRQIWILAQIDGGYEVVKGDLCKKYILLCNAHDGSGALRVFFTEIRVVCANTRAIAIRNAKREDLYIRHTSNLKSRVEKAKEVLGLANNSFEDRTEFVQSLAGLQINGKAWTEFTELMFPDPPQETDKEPSQRTMTMLKNNRGALTKLWESGTGMDIAGVHGTGWGALCAVTEFVNYERTTRAPSEELRQERRFESAVWGSGSQLVKKAEVELAGRL